MAKQTMVQSARPFLNRFFLVIIDAFSKWSEVIETNQKHPECKKVQGQSEATV